MGRYSNASFEEEDAREEEMYEEERAYWAAQQREYYEQRELEYWEEEIVRQPEPYLFNEEVERESRLMTQEEIEQLERDFLNDSSK